MRFYTQQHQYSCGIDLHARTMYVCILDQDGEIVFAVVIEAAAKVADGQRTSIGVWCRALWPST